MSNRKSGNSFEHELARLFMSKGYWVHEMTQSAAGQPADLVIISAFSKALIDCKVCSKDYMPLSRVEPNQIQAMKYFKEITDGETAFFLKFPDGDIRWIEAETVFEMMDRGEKRLHYDQTYEYIG